MVVLVVHGVAGVRDSIRATLRSAGFAVSVAGDADAALALARALRPTAIIIDGGLLNVEGDAPRAALRREAGAGLLVLTPSGDNACAGEAGRSTRDQTLKTPVRSDDLLAGVHTVMQQRSPTPRARRLLPPAALELDAARREIHVAGSDVPMRAKEFSLLLAFLEHDGEMLSRARLLEIVWGYRIEGTTRTVDVHVNHLRQRLAGSCLAIETGRGAGYRLVRRAITTPIH